MSDLTPIRLSPECVTLVEWWQITRYGTPNRLWTFNLLNSRTCDVGVLSCLFASAMSLLPSEGQHRNTSQHCVIINIINPRSSTAGHRHLPFWANVLVPQPSLSSRYQWCVSNHRFLGRQSSLFSTREPFFHIGSRFCGKNTLVGHCAAIMVITATNAAACLKLKQYKLEMPRTAPVKVASKLS